MGKFQTYVNRGNLREFRFFDCHSKVDNIFRRKVMYEIFKYRCCVEFSVTEILYKDC